MAIGKAGGIAMGRSMAMKKHLEVSQESLRIYCQGAAALQRISNALCRAAAPEDVGNSKKSLR